jgi:enoyl-CoA hydratase/carnithine racemase
MVRSAGSRSTSRLRRNAVSLDMEEAIPVLLNRFVHDPAVRVIVRKGAGEQLSSRRRHLAVQRSALSQESNA